MPIRPPFHGRLLSLPGTSLARSTSASKHPLECRRCDAHRHVLFDILASYQRTMDDMFNMQEHQNTCAAYCEDGCASLRLGISRRSVIMWPDLIDDQVLHFNPYGGGYVMNVRLWDMDFFLPLWSPTATQILSSDMTPSKYELR
ncbi:hypothetical protein NEOLEDRAFT_689276 [Neolentinus lepideus HHB14362 ss-1]|uniref:Uncharacterized protein n=1 Tax=Neolentinus lepideus HHB14362 ss-1 TaxID=1314782 RepID=A0A165V0Z3_9AGAM|nr:hypothetical protein NEOLEDRAFT_689276 [Neolentinus lepideus HHB14362 ss-1]